MTHMSVIAAAVAARSKAYAPYSRFLVGAAVKDEHGAVHAGCNVENAAYPEGTCAEAGAIAAMIMGGGRRITEAAVAGAGDVPVTPCGGCRQKLREFGAPGLVIHVCDETGRIRRNFTLEELLPQSFGPENLAP
ncbi:MAG: cytidine deaminase [Parvibaculaceae bacterium]